MDDGGVPFSSSLKFRVGRGWTVPSVTYSSSSGPLGPLGFGHAYSICSSVGTPQARAAHGDGLTLTVILANSPGTNSLSDFDLPFSGEAPGVPLDAARSPPDPVLASHQPHNLRICPFSCSPRVPPFEVIAVPFFFICAQLFDSRLVGLYRLPLIFSL